MSEYQKRVKIELFNDHFENAKRYQIPRAQLIIADIPYNIGKNAYGSRSDWYVGGDNKNGESKKANSEFFDTDKDFKIYNFFNFCTRLLKKEPKEKGQAPCMIIFCSWQQLNEITEYSKQFGFKHTQPLFFVKKSSSQVLKANMRIVGATECALVLWRDKLPKFRNGRQIGEDGKGIVIKLADLPYSPLWKVEPLIAITEYLGFTIEQVYEAYCGKNKINYQRLKEGY